MEKLLEAIKAGNEEEIDSYACELLIDNRGGCNWQNIREFEKLSGSRIFALEKDSFGWLIGGIEYNGKIYPYG